MSFGSLGAAGSGWQVAVVTRQDGPMPHEPIRYRSADEDRWRVLVAAASFASMRSRANEITPNTLGVLKDNAAFFRAGRSGAGRDVLSGDELVRYEARVASSAPPDAVAWLHR
jgi:hypothetical protein